MRRQRKLAPEASVRSRVCFTHSGEGLGAEKASRLPVLEPVLTYQIILPEEVSPAVMLRLQELEEEEPQLHIVWDETLKEIQVQVMGKYRSRF